MSKQEAKLHYTNLEDIVINRHKSVPTESIKIISGYVGVDPIKRLRDLPDNIHATIIYGMYGCVGISSPLHQELDKLQNELANVEIRYATIPVHSKIYYWEKSGALTSALIGSANFSVSGLSNDYKEVLSEVCERSYDEFKEYYQHVISNSIPCTDASIVPKSLGIKKSEKKSTKPQPLLAKGVCRVSFLNTKQLVPKSSGLNWCCSKGHVSGGDAYIPIRLEHIKQFPQMFPPKKYVGGIENTCSAGKKNRENDEVELIWDDGTTMIGLLEGQTVWNNAVYPKQLCSSPKKSILGEYLRKRIGVDLNRRITKTDLRHYGRTHIDISMIAEGLYYIDFSV